ncbi:stress-induced-phosphoprotein 1-like isoform X1 [Panicum virgatum]|nr:stress-induced-phosphoprotein 1-like isoform X1 [Panicum virgatum]
MKLLVEAGADVNFRSPSAPTVLMLAVDDGLTDIVNFLLEVGADPNIHDSDGKFPIMLAAAHEHRELAEILFPRTKPIPSMIDWSVDGIIRAMKYPHLEPREVVEEKIADAKSQGKEAFAKGDYLAAIYFYALAMRKDPLDATLFANRSLCWLRLREGEMALSDARDCRVLNPGWAKAWYREGAALSLLKNYKAAADAFVEALKLDPANNEIKKALREAMESMNYEER